MNYELLVRGTILSVGVDQQYQFPGCKFQIVVDNDMAVSMGFSHFLCCVYHSGLDDIRFVGTS